MSKSTTEHLDKALDQLVSEASHHQLQAALDQLVREVRAWTRHAQPQRPSSDMPRRLEADLDRLVRESDQPQS